MISKVVIEVMKETLHIYTRVSTAAQEDGAALDTQKDQVQRTWDDPQGVE